jgi:hypothetical protein
MRISSAFKHFLLNSYFFYILLAANLYIEILEYGEYLYTQLASALYSHSS